VLQAMGLNSDLGRASLRFSLGFQTTEKEILDTIDWVKKVVGELRGEFLVSGVGRQVIDD
jgi:cysteine desulfurase